MSDRYTDALTSGPTSRSGQLDQVLVTLLRQAPELQAAAVVSFDGLPMASMLPQGMDEDRVAAMSAALLSLGERAAEGLGRGALSQVYVEGEHGTVFLVSADDEAVLVAVGAQGAKVGLLLFEVRRAAVAVATTLRAVDPFDRYEVVPEAVPAPPAPEQPVRVEAPAATVEQPQYQPEPQPEPQPERQPEPQPEPQYQLEPTVDEPQRVPAPAPTPAPPVTVVAAAPAPAPAPRPEERRDWGSNGSTPRPATQPSTWQ